MEEIAQKKRFQPEYQKSELIIIDYLQLMSVPAKTRENKTESRRFENEYIVKELKKLALETSTPIFIISQLGRKYDFNDDYHPSLDDLRECAVFDKALDVVMYAFRNRTHNDKTMIMAVKGEA